MTAPHPVPMVPGWHVHKDGSMLVARRATGLTEYMRAYGALDEIRVRDLGELWVLCDAQTRLAERLATAEWLAPRTELLQPAADPAARERGHADGGGTGLRRGPSGAAAGRT
jgi:hypothetical protein